MRVNCLFGARMDAVGPYGMNAASENADELNVMWNGIGWVMLNTRDAGMYSCHRARARAGPRQPGERGRVYVRAAFPARVRARGWGARAGGGGGGGACSRFSCVEGVIEEVEGWGHCWRFGGGLEDGLKTVFFLYYRYLYV